MKRKQGNLQNHFLLDYLQSLVILKLNSSNKIDITICISTDVILWMNYDVIIIIWISHFSVLGSRTTRIWTRKSNSHHWILETKMTSLLGNYDVVMWRHDPSSNSTRSTRAFTRETGFDVVLGAGKNIAAAVTLAFVGYSRWFTDHVLDRLLDRFETLEARRENMASIRCHAEELFLIVGGTTYSYHEDFYSGLFESIGGTYVVVCWSAFS